MLRFARPFLSYFPGLGVVTLWIFSRFAEITGTAKQMRWVLLSSGIMFREIATLVHLTESSKPAARGEARPSA